MDINHHTLKYLVNETLYNKLKKKYNKNSEDITFYKERILKLTAELFENDVNNKCLNDAFINYLQECISHLYALDMTKAYQQDYIDLSYNLVNNTNEIFDVSNSNSIIMKKPNKNKITKFVKITKDIPPDYPTTKEFNHLDEKFKNTL
tara:strand:- start:106 stop:549 length:444 start_codon:yes stop_codon:yes gene_type:complete